MLISCYSAKRKGLYTDFITYVLFFLLFRAFMRFVNDDKENNVLIFFVKECHAAKGNESFVLRPFYLYIHYFTLR